MERHEIAIIGTGPAGLEAAITAKVRNKSVLLLGGKNLSTKIEKAHMIKNYLGLPEISGETMQNSFRTHLEKMEIEITEDRVNTVYAMGDYFAIQGHSGMYEASAVILACGMSAARHFPGELENLGRGVSYCATCDASLYKGKSAVVIGYSKKEEAEAEFLTEIADKVYYLPMYQEEAAVNDKIEVRAGEKPLAIEKKDQKVQLITESGFMEADGIFILRDNVAPSQLVPGLTIAQNQVTVDRGMKTNIPGLFACGDITGAPYQYIKAAGEGNVAALSAVKYLADIK
ncbi:MAG: NAD(P)/FAD-dependent oxidoreductase [Lachnospiraceae bacterium]|nr:NAD(P)/FAD-dependent oxidoreductase [Lachnospiraceae bacterium]